MSEIVESVAQAICGDDNPENVCAIHRIRARAAVEAMRKPTEAMTAAGNKMVEWANGADDAWEAMIDEALK